MLFEKTQNRCLVTNQVAFEEIFGGQGGRYPESAKKTVALRAPEFRGGSGVPFAALIHPSNPDSGAYGGMSFVIFPVQDGPCMLALVVGTQGLSPDEAVLGRSGHARKTKAICNWLNKEYGQVELLPGPNRTRFEQTSMLRKT